ncbi:N-glycosyltransferase [Janthinobacterium sp. KBS0711]|uniref:glycosyltransferase n=1 Tax=unclassified Janthinobacterium TaxID=2610881 RepID=UPI000627AD2D|nr:MULTISPECIES: glycosyltransferase [unclassified Janthinobacterium]KKO65117.1 N-glycosyltransferase [Janthinobacterium sp. KBS0711]TSD71014.1 glycosyltransferase [Janthinobacterium sp. KBS0711]
MKLAILIKTYNEAHNINRCLDAVFEAIAGIAGGVEVLVADSLSTDATVAIARAYPVKIVQLTLPADRGCGAGVQLGYQHTRAQFVYLLDGDMELQGDFLKQALALIENDATLGGISGVLRDRHINNRFDRHRLKNKPAARAGDVEWLAGGGLYRRAALDEAGGYAGNRNLKAYEEAELGLRLGSHGWRMLRLDTVAVYHTGHAESTGALIWRQWRSRRMDAGGVLLKSALGRPWCGRVLRMCLHPLAVLGFWALVLGAVLLAPDWRVPAACLGLGGLAALALCVKKRSVNDAVFSILLWHLSAAGLIRGFVTARLRPPCEVIPSRVLSENTAAEAGAI